MPPVTEKLPPLPRLLFAIVRPVRAFFRTQAAGGVALMVAAVAAVVWANSPWSETYRRLTTVTFALQFGGSAVSWPLHVWVNDALMAVFFLVAGMEIKREMVVGELRSWDRAVLPLMAAAGGMLVPAFLYASLNHGGPGARGWGVPMATDIAFALGCVSLLGRRVPSSLVVFLTALAIFDDLGAILVIAVFYGHTPDIASLAIAGVLVLVLGALSRAKVQRVWPYLLAGALLWLAILRSGVHATLAGVVLGLLLPAQARRRPTDVVEDLEGVLDSLRAACAHPETAGGEVAALERHLESVQAPLDRIEHALHRPVAFGVVPLFALVNAGVALSPDAVSTFATPPALGVGLGLLVGKPVGVFAATWLTVRVGLSPRPTGAQWSQIAGVSVLAGIGFTMSLFIADLAFADAPAVTEAAKLGIFAASLLSMLLGLALLRFGAPAATVQVTPDEQGDVPVFVQIPRFADPFRLVPWRPSAGAIGKSLAELQVRNVFGVHVLGVRPAGEPKGLQPIGPDHRLTSDETLLLVGEPDALANFTSATLADVGPGGLEAPSA